MNNRLCAVVLVVALVVSFFVNVVLYFQNYSANQLKDDFDAYYNEFGNVIVESISYNFSPPVSMYKALKIALEHGGWNTTSLENMTVGVYLDYRQFWSNSTVTTPEGFTTHIPGSGSHLVCSITQPVDDYSVVTVGNSTSNMTYRYIWSIVVTHKSGVVSLPPPGLYWIDAATAEIIPTRPF
ncbi:MAG: hypothetical protein IAX21_04235 [Candidatus Bathyarchaeota archaeon]|nr:hypothetical protein [Candidatus Bathyarchaeum tardum]WGM89835.1 MAG: hypothetical protein NUK63_01545 [Candidatus Bathyarchaeum tardum]WNZ30068.1 MAG: hypothetical protein IAX21_04235 [Candidatus Bathyarchaeota archaeon]